jgi:hypothetical protein
MVNKIFFLGIFLASFAMSNVCQAELAVGLTDNFNITNPPDSNQNLELINRQTGTTAPNGWDDYGTGNTLPGGEYDDRVIINASGQLQIVVGLNLGNVIIPGQTDLTQSSKYRISWEQGGDNDWSFAKFNSTSSGNYRDCGIMVWGSQSTVPGRVQFYLNTASQEDDLFTPAGANGLHSFIVDVNNGIMKIYVDCNNSPTWTYDVSNIGTGRSGVGAFSFSARPYNRNGQDTVAYIDNFKYEYTVVPPEQCGDIGTVYLKSDISGPNDFSDCYVNGIDLHAFVLNWLECTDPANANCYHFWE